MKSTSFALGSLLAIVAIAQPHHQHHAFHHKRDGPPVVWVTKLDYVTETIGITTTIWVSEGFVAPSPSSTPTSTSFSKSVTPVPAQFFEPAQSSTPVPAPTPSTSSSVYVAPPAPKSTYTPPTTLVAVPTVAAPAPVATVASVPEVPVVAPYVAPTSSSVYIAPAVTSTAPSSGSGGLCSKSSPCTGDMTHYTAGMGACGWENDGSTDKVVALPHGMMGTQSNGNPYCGKMITIMHNGKTTTAEIVDKCMGCVGQDLDLSDAAWLALESMDASTDVGRTTLTWYFN